MTSILKDAVTRFTTLIQDTEPDGHQLWHLAEEIAVASQAANSEERDAALRDLCTSLTHANPQVAGLAAITGGSLVEEGASPEALGPALLEQLPRVLGAAVRFADHCVDAMGTEGDEESTAPEEEGRVVVAGHTVPDELMSRLFPQDPEGVGAYVSLDQWCYPAIACLTREPALRVEARKNTILSEMAAQLEAVGNSGGVAFLSKLLQVLDNEPLLVLDPVTRQGFGCRIGGVADNFQLHTLLMDALISPAPQERGFPEGLSGPRPKPEWVSVARGDGPQQAEDGPVGVWNLYKWTALNSQGRLPEGGLRMEHWVWNEGTPTDILPFDGVRVLLLGPASYQRSWNNARLFEALPAYVRIEEVLSPRVVDAWLQRLGQAAGRAESDREEVG